jgi:PAS domain S-box-containing protein
MRILGRRLHVVDVAVGVYAVAFFTWLGVRTPGTTFTQAVAIAAFVPLGLAVAWANWRNAVLPGLDARTRIAWHLLALSALLLYVSGNAWDVFLRLFGSGEWPAWVDQLEMVHHLLIIAACLVFPGRSFEGRRRARFLLDASLVVVAGITLAMSFGFRLWFTNLQGGSLGSAITGPGLDCIVFVVAAVGCLQKRDRGTRAALAFLVAAGTTYLLANYTFTTAAFGPGAAAYHPGDSVDGLWFGAWVFRWVAARAARYRYQPDTTLAPRPGDTGAASHESSGVPYLIVAGSCVLLTSQMFADDQRFLGPLAFSAALMVGLLLVRQIVELRENNWLFAGQLAQEARFRSLVQHSSDVVLVVDSGGAVSYASPTAASLFGVDVLEQPGRKFVDLVREDDRPVLAPVLVGGRGPRRLQLHMPARQGGWCEVEALWNDLRADPAVNGIVVNCRDVTDRNELARQLRHTQKLDAVGHLTGGLAHDLNNVLAIIRGYTELLREELGPDSPAIDDLAHIQQAVDRAASVTRKVLAFSRRQPAQVTVLDLNVLVGDLLPMLRQSVSARAEVRLRLEAGLWPVRGDQGQMEQVLVNLATNARDAMPKGGVFEVETANRVVMAVAPSTGGLPPGDYVSLLATDTGVGVSPDVLARIFEPFFSTKSADTGMGLGLAMVHGFILDAGGRILVESTVGRGSSFTILLPRTDLPVAIAASGAGAPEHPARPCVVLLVDDESNVRAVARRLLERDGYRVVEASNGRDAADVLGDVSVELDVLLTDLVMPGLSGRQLIARCEQLRPDLPVVCMTGFSGESDDPRQFGKNLVSLLSKPFSSEVLRRAVASAVAGRRLP